MPLFRLLIPQTCSKEGIVELKNNLEKLILNAELFNTEIDERWLRIKEKLQKKTKSDYYLDETIFRNICFENSLKNIEEQKNLIQFLHDLGLILHFDNVHLAEYFVLDPYWITYGVYQILTSRYVGEQKGIVRLENLEFIINREKEKDQIYRVDQYKKITYSNNQRRFLIEILHEFKLCFFIKRSHFIIPDLLNTNEPLSVTIPIRKSKNSIKFIYQYSYLPKSILPFVMVEIHNLISHIWRTGFIINSKEQKALVSSYQSRIIIIVEGEDKRKRDILSAVRFVIDKVNLQLPDPPQMLIPISGDKREINYEEILEMEADGETILKLYNPKKEVLISKLLEGIEKKSAMANLQKSVDILLENQNNKNTSILKNQVRIEDKLDQTYHYLKSEFQDDIKKSILPLIEDLNDNQAREITEDFMQFMVTSFRLLDEELNKKQQELYSDLKKNDYFEFKMKYSTPLYSLLGIGIEAKFDVKGWAKKMYKDYNLKLFKVLGEI